MSRVPAVIPVMAAVRLDQQHGLGAYRRSLFVGGELEGRKAAHVRPMQYLFGDLNACEVLPGVADGMRTPQAARGS